MMTPFEEAQRRVYDFAATMIVDGALHHVLIQQEQLQTWLDQMEQIPVKCLLESEISQLMTVREEIVKLDNFLELHCRMSPPQNASTA
jgi:hypothetical protein|tara:strand:- start:527 stop:790 length:264 start_codon:yes stop_codon:yes gene_type:complete